MDPGATVTLSIGYSPADGQLSMSEYYRGEDGSTFTRPTRPPASRSPRPGPAPTSAARRGTGRTPTPRPRRQTKTAAYSNVSLTTYSGHTSTLWSWWVHHKLLANTGQQSGSDWVAIPADLTNGGANFQTWLVPQNRQGPNQPALP